MATDSSPPRIRIILTTAFSSVVILGALNFVFQSYFKMMTAEVEHDHLRPAEELIKLREGEQRNLASGALPITRVMADMASKGREMTPDVMPKSSDDMGPMVGWIRAPNQAVIDKLTAQQEAAADAGAAPAPSATLPDGGTAAVATDGGAVPGTTPPSLQDGGAAPTKMNAPGKGPTTTAKPDAGAH